MIYILLKLKGTQSKDWFRVVIEQWPLRLSNIWPWLNSSESQTGLRFGTTYARDIGGYFRFWHGAQTYIILACTSYGLCNLYASPLTPCKAIRALCRCPDLIGRKYLPSYELESKICLKCIFIYSLNVNQSNFHWLNQWFAFSRIHQWKNICHC